MVYVGGLAEEVDEKIIHAAFIPFGDIIDINIPLDYESGQYSVRLCVSLIMFHALCISIFLCLDRKSQRICICGV